MQHISLCFPDDWHLHLRDGEILKIIIKDTVRNFKRALIMPNTNPPIITTSDVQAYRQRILDSLPSQCNFSPLMTIYLTETTDPDDVEQGFHSG
ncbi:dihydroorotase, partial [Candidatus Liberibacter solanacearum]